MSWIQCDEIGGALGYLMTANGADASSPEPAKPAKKKGRKADKGALVVDEKAAENERKQWVDYFAGKLQKGRMEPPADAEPFYLTTAINYTNGLPHMGHAYEGIFVSADDRNK
jgi:hypothetical protein